LRDDGGPANTVVFLFGENINKVEWKIVKEITAPFYVYNFISDTKQEYVVLSPDAIELGDYILHGVTTPVMDLKNVSNSLKMLTNCQHIFLHSLDSKIIRYANMDDFRLKISQMNVTKSTLFDYPFTTHGGDVKNILKYPEWFKWLIWAWLLHSNHGLTNKYPLHLLIIGPKNSGKTQLINNLHAISLESGQVFSGVSSTLKDLVPSFRSTPPRRGYLADSNRFSFLDEFLRCITRSSDNQDVVDEQVALMNDLLEHQKRRAGSGNGSITVNMSSRVIAATNPVRAVKNVTDLLSKHDPSFMSRWLILWQPKEMIDIARDTLESDLKQNTYEFPITEFISVIDFLHQQRSEYDLYRVQRILDSAKSLLNETLLDHYMARHRHHLFCLMDGVIKARCLFERNLNFRAKDEDYEMVGRIWANTVKSWVDAENIASVPIEYRHHYLHEIAQFAYKVLCREKRPLVRDGMEALLLEGLSKGEYLLAVSFLQKAELLLQEADVYRVWWYKPGDDCVEVV